MADAGGYLLGAVRAAVGVLRALGGTDYHRQVLARRVVRSAFGEEFAFASLEDCVLLKVVAGRPVDRADAVELLRLHAERVDRAYLNASAVHLGVVQLLQDCLAEARGPQNPY